MDSQLDNIISSITSLTINEKKSVDISNDISGKDNINELFEKSLYKKWIKLIPIKKTILLEEYNRKTHFIPIADINLDTEINTTGKKKGLKKRNTLIKIDKLANINKQQFEEKKEWIYIITINERIVKIGGTRDGIKNRFGSYLCGHHIPERNKSGKASETNKYIYNTLHFYLDIGCKIKLYGYELPQEYITRTVFGKDVKIRVQTYHSYESILMDEYKSLCGVIPFLCDNCDPEYKE